MSHRLFVPETAPPAAGMSVERPPFLARETLLMLAFAPPLLTLLTAQLGSEAPSLSGAGGCLVATWLSTLSVGLLVHCTVNWIAPRLLSAGYSTLAAAAVMATVVALSVVASMLLLLPRIAWLSPHLQGGLAPYVIRGVAVAAIYVTAGRLYSWMAARSRSESERAGANEQLALRARLAALQAQTNPHFLFNTLNAVASLIPDEPALAEATVERLAGVLQYSITSSARGTVSLGEELSAVRDYLAIEQARFGARLRSRIDVLPSLHAVSLPPMLLQPLVENAVLHGLASRVEGGEIWVTGRVELDEAVLTVADNGVGPGGSPRRGNRTALPNLRERLALTYGGAARFEVRARDGGGFECELRVPLTIAG